MEIGNAADTRLPAVHDALPPRPVATPSEMKRPKSRDERDPYTRERKARERRESKEAVEGVQCDQRAETAEGSARADTPRGSGSWAFTQLS